MKNKRLHRLLENLEEAREIANYVNIGIMPNEDIHKLIKLQQCLNELVNYLYEE